MVQAVSRARCARGYRARQEAHSEEGPEEAIQKRHGSRLKEGIGLNIGQSLNVLGCDLSYGELACARARMHHQTASDIVQRLDGGWVRPTASECI